MNRTRRLKIEGTKIQIFWIDSSTTTCRSYKCSNKSSCINTDQSTQSVYEIKIYHIMKNMGTRMRIDLKFYKYCRGSSNCGCFDYNSDYDNDLWHLLCYIPLDEASTSDPVSLWDALSGPDKHWSPTSSEPVYALFISRNVAERRPSRTGCNRLS